MSDKDYQRELNAPFESHEIEWRVSRKGVNNGKPWVVVFCYITSRAVQDRLDSVFGIFGWENHVKEIRGNGFLSGISIFQNDRWITKWDGAEGSTSNGMDLVKSGSSNALKRAAVLLGIGRYLYELDEVFATSVISDSYKHPYGNVIKDKDSGLLVAWQTPELPKHALPGFDIDLYISDIKKANDIDELESSYGLAKQAARLHDNKNMLKAANDAGIAKKEELDNKALLRIQEDTKGVTSWLIGQLKAFSMISNATSVESFNKLLIKDLKKRIKGTAVDIEPLQKTISESFTARINELTPQGNENGK